MPSAAPAASAPTHQGQRLFSPNKMAATMTQNAIATGAAMSKETLALLPTPLHESAPNAIIKRPMKWMPTMIVSRTSARTMATIQRTSGDVRFLRYFAATPATLHEALQAQLGDDYAQAEDGVELGIPGFGREAVR